MHQSKIIGYYSCLETNNDGLAHTVEFDIIENCAKIISIRQYLRSVTTVSCKHFYANNNNNHSDKQNLFMLFLRKLIIGFPQALS